MFKIFVIVDKHQLWPSTGNSENCVAFCSEFCAKCLFVFINHAHVVYLLHYLNEHHPI